jgi:NAD(P)H-hydrate epimerase
MDFKIDQLLSKFPARQLDSHKGDYGHVFVLAGSCGYTGAPYLASQAALVSGSGLVTLGVGKSIYPILASKLIEVMVWPLFETKDSSPSLMAEKDIISFMEKCDCLAMGPGLSQNSETQRLVCSLIGKLTKPIVLDADGINALAGHADILKSAKAAMVLTPHAGELSRLTGKTAEEVQKDRKDIALKFANEYNTVLILKGHGTIVAAPNGDCYINETGNAGMATGGTGDVLTGMVASFIGQKCDPFTAACLAAYFHGLAGDIAVKEVGQLSLAASDLLYALPMVLRKLA